MAKQNNEGRTLDDLRNTCWDEIEALRSGNTTPAKANAVANLNGKILSSIKLEIEYFKMLGQTPDIKLLGGGKAG